MKEAPKVLSLDEKVIVIHDGRLKRIRKAVDLEKMAVDDIETGKCDIVKISDLQVVGRDVPTEEGKQVVETLLVSEEDWAIARLRLDIITPLLDKPRRTRAEVEARAKEFEYEATALYRWINDYEPTRTLESLLPKQVSDAKGSKRLGELVEGIVQLAIAQYPQVLKTPHAVWEEIKNVCRKIDVKWPHESTIRNRCDKIPVPEELGRRRGKKAARDKYAPKPDHFEGATHPLSIYQIDHLRMPTYVVDEKYRKVIGKAWITLVIDVFSRVIPGFAILIEAPGTLGLGLAMSHSILPKETWLATRGVEGKWPIWGKPRVVHADNAKEFRGNTHQLAAKNMGFRIEWRLVETPEFGGHIERLCGTLKKQLISLPGSEERPGKRNEDRDAQGEACLTLQELERWVTEEIVNKYHVRVHTGIGVPPLTKYMEGILGNDETPGIGYPQRIVDERWLRLQWTPYKMLTIQQYGIRWNNVHYWDPALAPYINTIDEKTGKSRLFVVRRDPRDISRVYVFIPELNDHIDVPYRSAERPAVTLWELKRAQAELHQRGLDATDEDLIFATIDRQRQMVEDAAAKTKSARRLQQRGVESARGVKESGVPPRVPPAAEAPAELDYANVTAFEEDDHAAR